jgi:hypothetical protein
MLRKSTALLCALGLVFAIALAAGGSPAAAGPLRQATPTPEHAMEDEHGGSHGERIDAGDASIRIVAPADGATISGDSVAVKVETINWPLGEGKHWHLYVDGKEQGMSQGNSDTLMAHDLAPGEHEIEVVLSNELHQELEAVDHIEILAEAAAAPQAAAAGDNSLLLVGGVVVVVLAVAGVAFAVARRK